MGSIEFLDHPADVYIRVTADTILDMYATAGKALFETMTATEALEPRVEREVGAEGYDMENLLYRWLEELLALYYTENIMCRDVFVDEIIVRRVGDEEEYVIRGRCRGETFDPERHEPRVEVKAVTYSLMRIVKDEKGWLAEFVLDI